MPNPIDILLDPISLTVIGIFLTLLLWEKLFPRHQDLPQIKYASLRGILAFIIFFYLSSYLPLFTDEFLASYQLIDLSHLHLSIQVFIGIFFYQFAIYVWHRSLHKSNILWKVFHQMHHSSEKLDIPSTFYFSPVDMIGFTLLGSLVFALIMGVSPNAATIIILALNFLSIFQHANIKTPVFLGYFIQRPEQHAIHHARGVHQFNYSDLPVFDLIFGTFQNPKDYQGKYGFYNGASSEVWNMLRFKRLK